MCADRLPVHIRRMRSGGTRFTLTMASYVTTSRGRTVDERPERPAERPGGPPRLPRRHGRGPRGGHRPQPPASTHAAQGGRSSPPTRCAPRCRAMMQIRGGQSLASVPRPRRGLARRRGGAVGSRGGLPVFPRVGEELVCLKGGTGHHGGRCGPMPGGLAVLPPGMPRCAAPPQRAWEAGRGLTLGHAAPPPHPYQDGRALAGVRQGGPRQQGIVAIASPATVGRQVALLTAAPPRRAPAVRAVQAARVPVPLPPHPGEAIV
jgi:hypothetical protein